MVAEGVGEILKNELDVSNCLRIWKMARDESLKNLKDASGELANKNFEQVFTSAIIFRFYIL
jgi:hypothetical protein